MKKYFILAAAALAFAACTSDEIVPVEPQQTAEENAVTFDVYTQRGVTRGGVVGSVTTTDLKSASTDLGKAGFGVFGFYTDNNDYDQRNIPNFFYNQQVKWDGSSAFTYAPIKYWPNEYGTNAISDDADKVTYFAYAPWVEVIPTSGKLKKTDAGEETWGITGMTRNNNQGDPILKYIGSFDTKYSVDLCWGVIDNGDTNWNIVNDGTIQDGLKAGLPWANVYRPAQTYQPVRFTFKHATSQMKVSIDADVDITSDVDHSSAIVDAKTRVWVRQVTFTGFAMKGALNLNNEVAYKPLWLDYNGQNDIVSEDLVVYDGRKDGKEGVNGAVASNEKSVGLNPTLVQDGVYAPVNSGKTVYNDDAIVVKNGTDTRTGVTNTAVNLFNNTNGSGSPLDFFYVIPTGDDVTIEIVYDIETVDENLSTNLSDGQTKGSGIENRISKKISVNGAQLKLEAGHSYTLNLHLGMNSVEFDAAVTDWIEEPTQDVDLPANTPMFAAGTTPAPYVTLPYTGNYTFAITGLDGGESTIAANVRTIVMAGDPYTITPNAEFTGWGKTANNAKPSGVAVQTVTTAPNPNTTAREQEYKWTGGQSGKVMDLHFVQSAHPLFMKVIGAASQRIILYRYNDATQSAYSDWGDNSGWFCDASATELTTNGDPDNTTTPTNGIAVFRNGTELVWQAADDPTGNHFQFKDNGTKATSAYAATIEFGDPLKNGDVIKVILKTGEAPVETVTYTVSGL